MRDEERFTLSQAHQRFAKMTFNSIWELLEKEDRSQEEDQDMLLAAYASLYHWTKVGTAVHYQRGSWMISRVHQCLGEAEPCLAWAYRCQEISESHSSEMEDFDLAYAQEALARAYALAGDQEHALHHWQQAAALGERIKDQEDKEIFLGDFQGGNWYQLQTD
jgi:hypothetical protein